MNPNFRTPARFGLTLQTFKTALAAALSWWLATVLAYNNYPYFAPLAAILTVQVTVADSLEKAVQRIVGIILGVAVSVLIGHWFSIGALSIFLVILAGMAISNSLRLNNQITSQVAVSSLLVLAFGHSQGYAFGRIVETMVGCAVAVGINAFLIPPNAIPSAEASLLALGKRAASTLSDLTLLLGQKGGNWNGYNAVESLIIETGKSLQAIHLAKQSQKFSPFLAKTRARLDVLSYGMNQLERVTVQIRGIRRSLADLRDMEDYKLEYPKIERISEALRTAAACLDHFGEMAIQPSDENKDRQGALIRRAQTVQLACLNEMTQVGSPLVLREVGGILTDLDRIVKEVSADL
ncbi:FUSC family protein [Gordoniibacillus kamchatkensis]|uniref:FUSC family protein n=1 Tax=Gordoniibacillus kamchatkensis TaxID=1590651 RepID=UPI0006970F15|nr:aromatic acid exporter family protein [Paenibacillus sp. VKM B-2647]